MGICRAARTQRANSPLTPVKWAWIASATGSLAPVSVVAGRQLDRDGKETVGGR
ncbi:MULTISPECIES: hypothetical protein [unclassified Streptomyces]|uniref:hypothetical protein n=1 Tax=unclassified Streptomyces TaxID=2593676 RepID=UPI002E18B33C|nr:MULTISPECIES: hypothetical protein [unclassified Streptomyces]